MYAEIFYLKKVLVNLMIKIIYILGRPLLSKNIPPTSKPESADTYIAFWLSKANDHK